MGAQFIASGFGGGWALEAGPIPSHELSDFFGEPAHPIQPLGGARGWIVEPWHLDGLAGLVQRQPEGGKP